MIYELREYTAMPGKLPALVKRFNEHTIRLFGKHGIELVFISHTVIGEDSINELVYLLRFDSYSSVESKWASFLQDPEWQKVKADSEIGGPLVQSVKRRLLDPGPFDVQVSASQDGPR